MATIIPAELRPFVSDAVASGRYRSEEELIAAALRLLEDRERKLAALRDDLQFGVDDLERGNSIDLSDVSARQAFRVLELDSGAEIVRVLHGARDAGEK